MASETTSKHKHKSPKKVRVAVITISDSKYGYLWTGSEGPETEDLSGKDIISQLKTEGHEIVFYCIIPDHAGMIVETIDHITETYCPDAVITTGGTGVGPRDVTIEAADALFDKKLDGFGELFRLESMKEVGRAAMLSRAAAGTIEGTLLFCLPGSPNAVDTGIKLILSEIGHLVKHAKEG
ncbi:MAG: molybdenum cofactor biosynthesis protein B [Candidatus Hydrothermarchaeales archaeon]